MKNKREYRRLTVGRKMDEKQLRSTLRQIVDEVASIHAPSAAPIRLESVLIEPSKTTVYFSGNESGLRTITAATKKTLSDANVSKARRADARGEPRGFG